MLITVDSREYARLVVTALAGCYDDVTGLLGRRGLRHAYAALPEPPRALALLDLDGFKQVNDTFGHEGGDAVLRITAGRIRQHADVVARLGGDEFVALIPTYAVAGRIAALIAEPIYLGSGATTSVRASIGVAIPPADLHTDPDAGLSELLRRADRAMYRAKAGGGGVRLWSRVDAGVPTHAERAGIVRGAA
jgi:diguanylate cyclase (GGDEF)-like protein